MVEDVTTLDIAGVDKKREYYILKPVYVPASTVYVPVDAAHNSLRRALNREEADRLIREIPGIPLITITNDKLLEQEYKGCLHANDCTGLIRIIKTIYQRKLSRLAAGRKITAVDARYSRMAEDNLYGELSIALQIPRSEVESTIVRMLDGDDILL